MKKHIQLTLVLGGMGHGKTTLVRGMRDKGIRAVMDTDECRVAPIEERRKKLIRKAVAAKGDEIPRRWRDHNEQWFAQVWGGIGLFTQTYDAEHITVSDHGGWFILETPDVDVNMLVRRVVALIVPLDVAQKRVAERGGSPEDEKLVEVSWTSYQRVIDMWRDKGYHVTRIDGRDEPSVVRDEVIRAIQL
uniref:Uncharacterized protein n=1 Tax=viral metagenome TaxID=1070528 RepID=A0A2V0R9V6_9ZZZZ